MYRTMGRHIYEKRRLNGIRMDEMDRMPVLIFSMQTLRYTDFIQSSGMEETVLGIWLFLDS